MRYFIIKTKHGYVEDMVHDKTVFTFELCRAKQFPETEIQDVQKAFAVFEIETSAELVKE